MGQSEEIQTGHPRDNRPSGSSPGELAALLQFYEELIIVTGVVAHDLNNMLTPVLGYASILKQELGAEHPFAKGVETIEKASSNAAAMISHLLGATRQIRPATRPADPEEILQALLADLEGLNTNVKITRASSCPAIEILADPRQIGLAIKAVIKNAIESMPDGGMVTIGTGLEEIDPLFCKTHPHVKPGRHFLLTVSDTGCGIPEEIRKRIFDPFITTKPASPDTGIGLTLALSIINKHFGALDVFSSRGEGTTVTIYIPVAD